MIAFLCSFVDCCSVNLQFVFVMFVLFSSSCICLISFSDAHEVAEGFAGSLNGSVKCFFLFLFCCLFTRSDPKLSYHRHASQIIAFVNI